MSELTQSHPLKACRSASLKGVAAVPGDKSISHRALILGALALGETKITGLLEAEDVLTTAEAVRAFGLYVYVTNVVITRPSGVRK